MPVGALPGGQCGLSERQTLRHPPSALAEIIEAKIIMMATKAFMVLLELLSRPMIVCEFGKISVDIMYYEE